MNSYTELISCASSLFRRSQISRFARILHSCLSFTTREKISVLGREEIVALLFLHGELSTEETSCLAITKNFSLKWYAVCTHHACIARCGCKAIDVKESSSSLVMYRRVMNKSWYHFVRSWIVLQESLAWGCILQFSTGCFNETLNGFKCFGRTWFRSLSLYEMWSDKLQRYQVRLYCARLRLGWPHID